MIGANKMSGNYTEAQKRATEKWQNEKTDLIRFRCPKGRKSVYQDLALRSGANSLTEYLNKLLEEKLKEEGL